MKCPLCKNEEIWKVIYYGFPVKFCSDDKCNCMFGFWTYLTDFFPFNGMLFVYKGNYWPALYRWLKGEED